MQQPETISREKLEKTMEAAPPTHESAEGGYALVNVLPREEFEKEHIPGSLNLPLGDLGEEAPKRFEKSKPIVVYCSSTDCDASPSAARALSELGFTNVYDYEEGMKGWKDAGHEVATGMGR